MRLATATGSNGGPALWASASGGYHCLSEQAAAFEGIRDVGDLLRADLLDLAAAVLAELDAVDPGQPLESLSLLAPVQAPRAIVCVGRNYAEHVAEGNVEMPDKPLLFSKFSNALAGHGAVVPYPTITDELDYEGELALVIGRRASRVSRDDALSYVAGYTVFNDVSARDLQDSDLQWIRGKSLDAFAPIGPCVVTADDIPDPYALRIVTTVNGEVRQDETVDEMHYRIDELLAFITEGITLEPGDVVATGTPAGVGLGFDPPRWLVPGDAVDVTIEGIGTLSATVGPSPA